MEGSGQREFDVIGLGGAAWDLLGIVRHYPQPGEKAELIAFEEQGGGQAATAMVAVARLGGRAAMVGNTADDGYGDKIRRGFEAEGVDISHLHTHVGATSHIAFCMIPEDTGERAIFFTRGSKRRLKPEELDREFLLSGACLLVDTHHWKAAVRACQWAREAGLPVVTDLERTTRTTAELFRLGTHHIVPEHYLLEYTRQSERAAAVRKLREQCDPEVLVITRGVQGAEAYVGEEVLHQPAFPVEPVVDTTGAGDVFHGAFAYGLALDYELPTNLEFAALVAGLKCRRLGGRAGIPTREELATVWRHPLP